MSHFLLGKMQVAIIICSVSCQKLWAQVAVRSDEGFVLIDEEGDVMTKTSYDFIGEESSGRYTAVKNGSWGYLNNSGEEVVPFIYDVAYPFNGHFALVGENRRYSHINSAHVKVADLAKPEAPAVYESVLVSEDGNFGSKVTDYQGRVIYQTPNRLFVAKESGILEWRQGDSIPLIQYHYRFGDSVLRKRKEYSDADTFIITQQGYLCVRSMKGDHRIYTLYDKSGVTMGSMNAEGIHPNYIRTVWGRFLYNPKQVVFRRETYLGPEVHYPMKGLTHLRYSRPSQHVFQLCDRYAESRVALLPNAGKWLPFDGNNVIGSRMFDDVVPGDRHYVPVKIDSKWYILDVRQDSLIKTPFRSIHHIGMSDGRFFASTQQPGIGDEQWAFVNWHRNVATDEVFGVPLNELTFLELFGNIERYKWHKSINVCVQDGKLVYLNNLGEIVWVDPDDSPIDEDDFFDLELNFSAANPLAITSKSFFARNKLSVYLSEFHNGVRVYFANTTKREVQIELQDGNVMAHLEMKDDEGVWTTLASPPPTFCGNSYFMRGFPSQSFLKTDIPLPKGSKYVEMRIRIELGNGQSLVSNNLTVATNAGRLWVEKYLNLY